MPRISCGSVELGKFIGYDTPALRAVIGLVLLTCLAWAQTELQQALTLARAGRFAEAREAIKNVPGPATLSQQIAYHRLKAAIASGLHEESEAAKEMEAALALSPNDRSLVLATAVSEEQAGHVEKAVDLLSQMDESAEVKGLLGRLFEKQGRNAESIKAYRDAIRLNPSGETLRVMLCRELIALGAFDQANSELKDSLRDFPQSAPLLTLFGILQYSGGQPERAKEIISRAIHADSRYQPAYVSLARMALESSSTPGKDEIAILCGWDAITCSALEVRVARDNNDKQLEERSIAVLRDAPPDNGTAACALGQAYAWDDRPEQARPKLENCVRLDPTPQNHYRLAQVYRKLGESQLAQEQLAARGKQLKTLSDQTARAADSLKALETKIK